MTTGSLISQEVHAICARMAKSYDAVEESGWKQCPACGEDYTKLEPWVFFKNVDGRYEPNYVHTCPPCKLSVNTIQWFCDQFGFTDLKPEIHRLPAFQALPREMHTDSQLYAVIHGFKLVPQGDRVSVFKSGEEKKMFDNIGKAVVHILASPAKKMEAEEERTW